jgi:NAD(P)-dependent dehydrogenase (short-subunit alcohol dehydrogenase family)
VAINYNKNRSAAQDTVEKCSEAAASSGQLFPALQADISDPEDRLHLLDETIQKMGRLDVLVNNAGIAPRKRGDITDMEEQSFSEVMLTNLQGPFFLTQQVVKFWLETGFISELNGGPKVVFITSISAYTASANRGEYCISKAGLSMAARLWASRLADQGIQVFEIRPGIMLTDMTRGVKDKYDRLIDEGLVPQKRWGTARDVGLAVCAVIGGGFPYSTGAIIDVDGGFRMRKL